MYILFTPVPLVKVSLLLSCMKLQRDEIRESEDIMYNALSKMCKEGKITKSRTGRIK